MKALHRLIAVLLIFILTMTSLAGCSHGAANHTDKIHLTVMLVDPGIKLSEGSLTANRWTKYINEQMDKYGIEIEFVPVSSFDRDETVKKMMSSGNAADIMIGKDPTFIRNYYPEGYTHNLACYISPELTPDLYSFIGGDSITDTTLESGEIWAIRAKRSNMGMSNIFLRKDWLDMLGLDIPTTPDELHAVLKAFSTLPSTVTVNKSSVIPAVFNADGSIGPLCCSFLECIYDAALFSSNTSDIYGTIICSDPGYERYLKYLNTLYSEGLLAQDFLVTDDSFTAVREYLLAGRLGAFEGPVNSNIDVLQGNLLQTLRTVCPEADYISIPALRNINDNRQYSNIYSGGGDYIFIPLSCKNPQAAVTYLNWLATVEGGFTLYNGFEGEHYTLIDGSPVPITSAADIRDKNLLRNSLFLLAEDGYFTSYESFLAQTAAEYPGYEQHVFANYTNSCLGARSRKSYYTYAVAFYGSVYKSICDTYMIRLLTEHPENFEEVAEEFRQKLNDAGISGLYLEQSTQ